MNDEHVAVVRQGAEAIAAWRKVHNEESLDLVEADLSRTALDKANLSEANLYKANLSGATFHEADLSDAELYEADLRGANLTDAVLRGINLIGANLTRSVLRGANLSNGSLMAAKLSEADLSEANFSEAQFRWTNFQGAELHGANFTGASFSDAILVDIDLSVVVGLERALHYGPSFISIDTLHKSNGKIPESFLRGCGVPDEFIAYIPSIVGTPFQFYSVFISYSHADKDFARRLHDTLQGRGIRCWRDEHSIEPGERIRQAVDEGLRISDKVLLCASEASLTHSWWVDDEIDKALNKEAKVQKETGERLNALIPLDLDGFLFRDDWNSASKETLLGRKAADFQNWKDDHDKFEASVDSVVNALALNKLPKM